MTRLYCPKCSEYLEGGDGECRDCSCGWKQEVNDQCFCGELDAQEAKNTTQAQQPNAWQQAIDDELVNAHLGIAKDGVTREEAKAQLNKLIAWHIDVAKYFESQAQQESLDAKREYSRTTGNAFIHIPPIPEKTNK